MVIRENGPYQISGGKVSYLADQGEKYPILSVTVIQYDRGTVLGPFGESVVSSRVICPAAQWIEL